MTSTSSLAFQLQGKCIPLKLCRERRDEYYEKPERKRSKPKRERERDRERRAQKPQAIVEDELPKKRDSKVKVPIKEEESTQQLYSQHKLNRQKGGRSPHDRKVSNLLLKNFKPYPNWHLMKTCQRDSSRNSDYCKANDTIKESSPDTNSDGQIELNLSRKLATTDLRSKLPEPNPSNSVVANVVPLATFESQPDTPGAASIPLSSPAQSSTACEVSSHYKLYWRTHFLL